MHILQFIATTLYKIVPYVALYLLTLFAILQNIHSVVHSIVIIWVKQSENGRQVEASFASELSFF